MKQLSFTEFEDTNYLSLPHTKVQHVRFDYGNCGLTLFSVLASDRQSLCYSFSVFNPKDKQFIKSVGRENAIQRFKNGDVSFIDLSDIPPELFSSRYITYLMLQQILFKAAIRSVNDEYPFMLFSRRFIKSLGAYLVNYVDRLYVKHNGKIARVFDYCWA